MPLLSSSLYLEFLVSSPATAARNFDNSGEVTPAPTTLTAAPASQHQRRPSTRLALAGDPLECRFTGDPYRTAALFLVAGEPVEPKCRRGEHTDQRRLLSRLLPSIPLAGDPSDGELATERHPSPCLRSLATSAPTGRHISSETGVAARVAAISPFHATSSQPLSPGLSPQGPCL